MAGIRVSIQAVLLLASLLAWQRGEAAPQLGGFGSFFGAGPGTTESSPSSLNPLNLPNKVFSAFTNVGSRPPAGSPEPPAATNHHHHHPPAAAPSRTAAPTTSTTAAAKPAKASEALVTPSPAPVSQSTEAVVVRGSGPSPDSSPDSSPTSSPSSSPSSSLKPDKGNYTDEQMSTCRDRWISVTNKTANENLDVLSILLDYGGFPGQLEKGVTWERNSTEEDLWTYFYGDTDYKTYVRSERGSIHSRHAPPPGANPETVNGELYWAPDDFCGKLRHALYAQEPELRATDQAQVCFFDKNPAGHDQVTCWNDAYCVPPLGPEVCPKGGVSGALMASLVG